MSDEDQAVAGSGASAGPSHAKTRSDAARDPGHHGLPMLTLSCIGVVYGDIGTSPLYALRECLLGRYGVAPTAENVIGVLSLVTWSLIGVISVKYLAFVLRVDNDGEGAVLAL